MKCEPDSGACESDRTVGSSESLKPLGGDRSPPRFKCFWTKWPASFFAHLSESQDTTRGGKFCQVAHLDVAGLEHGAMWMHLKRACAHACDSHPHGERVDEGQAHQGCGGDRETLPMVAVVLPVESEQSVSARSASGMQDISAMPIVMVPSGTKAPQPKPNMPHRLCATMIATPKHSTRAMQEKQPKARP